MKSEKHWRNLWDKLEKRVPAAEAAHDWRAPWVERLTWAEGTYCFNYVTGAQGFEHELGFNGTTPCAPTAASTGGYCPPCAVPVPQATQAAATPGRQSAAPASFDLAYWLWKRHADKGA